MGGPSEADPPIAYALPPRHGRLRRHGAWVTVAKVAASVVAVAAISVAAVTAYAAIDLLNTVKPPVVLQSEVVLEDVPDIGAMEGGLNFLLVGSDKRTVDGAFGDPDVDSAVLNDVTILLHISEDHSHASVVSFPRDMIVDVPACTDPADPGGDPLSELYEVKINSVLDHGGMPCVVKTIEQITGVSIPFAGVVQFMGAAAISEAVGGVEVCVAEPIEDEHTDLFLEAGTHELRGLPALQFLRTRYGVGDGSDLGRISNQQVFMSSLTRKVQADGTLNDPVKLFSIAKAALANMQLSDSLMDPTRMISIAKAVKDTDLANIAFIQYPTAYTDGWAALVPTESAEIVNLALQNDTPVVFDPAAGETDFASVDPNAPVPAEGEEPVDGEAEGTPVPTPGVEALPSDVSGQTAADTRCSAGRTLDDQ